MDIQNKQPEILRLQELAIIKARADIELFAISDELVTGITVSDQLIAMLQADITELLSSDSFYEEIKAMLPSRRFKKSNPPGLMD